MRCNRAKGCDNQGKLRRRADGGPLAFAGLALGLALASVPGCAVELGDPSDLSRSGDAMTFDEFVAQAHRETLEDGVWIVDGDTPVHSLKEMRDLYERLDLPGRLIVDRSGGRDSIWTEATRRNLTYCVSTSFGSRYDTTVRAMADAARAWEDVTDVRFVHVAAEDGACDARNPRVIFDVRPTSGAGYLARAFFPNNGRSWRNVIIDSSAYSSSRPSLTGILRHELGHTLGFRHEHTRPEAGRCFEDSSWRPLTDYDRASVMHYPHCGGTNRELVLSSADIAGVRALYGLPSGGAPPPAPPPAGADRAHTYDDRLARHEQRSFGPFEVVPGSRFTVVMSGSGDADLHVRLGAPASLSAYDCRPYREDANETCELDVPAGTTSAFVMVNGYSDTSYQLAVRWRSTSAAIPSPSPGAPPPGGTDPPADPPPSDPPADPPPSDPPADPPPSDPPAGGSGPQSARGAGTLARGALQRFAPLAVVPGSRVEITMSGTGDPDLYVAWDREPTVETNDCASAGASASERCSLLVPAGVSSALILVHAFSDSTFELDARWTAP